jgi:CheY-like chemotaxis protein
MADSAVLEIHRLRNATTDDAEAMVADVLESGRRLLGFDNAVFARADSGIELAGRKLYTRGMPDLACEILETLQALRNAPAAAILPDIQLQPGIYGLEVLRQMRKIPTLSLARVVVLSNHGFEDGELVALQQDIEVVEESGLSREHLSRVARKAMEANSHG